MNPDPDAKAYADDMGVHKLNKPAERPHVNGPDDHYAPGQYVFSRDERNAYQVQRDGSWRKLPKELGDKLIAQRKAADLAKRTKNALAALAVHEEIAKMEDQQEL